jgi:hypothetical protein
MFRAVHAQSGLARLLRKESDWTLVYEDDPATIFTREVVGAWTRCG